MKYQITKNNLHIFDSYKISKKKFDSELNSAQALHKESDVWKRSRLSLKLEWATHNALYALGIAKDRTKDVDLNYPQKWYVKTGYAVVGSLVWLFIK